MIIVILVYNKVQFLSKKSMKNVVVSHTVTLVDVFLLKYDSFSIVYINCISAMTTQLTIHLLTKTKGLLTCTNTQNYSPCLLKVITAVCALKCKPHCLSAHLQLTRLSRLTSFARRFVQFLHTAPHPALNRAKEFADPMVGRPFMISVSQFMLKGGKVGPTLLTLRDNH